MNYLLKLLVVLLTVPLAWAATTPAWAEDTESAGLMDGDKRCVNLSKIRGLEILDDHHIAFRVARNRYYVNTLRRRCPGLTRHSTIMYETSIGRLCDLDMISVLDSFGFGYRKGPSCGLGQFTEIDKVALDTLRQSLGTPALDLN